MRLRFVDLGMFSLLVFVVCFVALIANAHDRVPKDDDRPCVACPSTPCTPPPTKWIPCRHTKHGDRCSTHKFYAPAY